LLVSAENELPYLRPALSKELWSSQAEEGDLSFTDWQGHSKPLLLQPASFYSQKGVQVKLSCRVQSVDPDAKRATLEDGRIIEYDQALIATGARPKSLGHVPLIADRISSFRSLADFQALKQSITAHPGQRVLIVGGGFLGSELAVSLAQLPPSITPKVTQIFPESGPMGLVFPKYLSEWTRDKLSSLGIKLIPRVTIDSVDSRQGEVMKVQLSNGQTVETDHVIVAIGVEPLLPQLPSSISPKTDAYLQLASSLFGAGDAIEYPDRSLGIDRRTEHYDHAVHSGKLAGKNMVRLARAEPLQEYTHESMFWSDLGKEVGYEAVGLVDSSLTTVSVWSRAGPEDQPGTAELDPSDVRIQSVGQTAVRSNEEQRGWVDIEAEIPEEDVNSKIPKYGKGVVLYLKDQRLVGLLMFNLFNRVALARSLIAEGVGPDDINKVIQLINIHE
jgi:programmed cell death 8 (apoptosis-inducing factor)